MIAVATLNLACHPLPAMDKANPGRPAPPARAVKNPPEAESSVELLARARAGDNQALDNLFSRYLPRLERWAHGRLPPWARDARETQDLVQDTLTQVFLKLGSFEPRFWTRPNPTSDRLRSKRPSVTKHSTDTKPRSMA